LKPRTIEEGGRGGIVLGAAGKRLVRVLAHSGVLVHAVLIVPFVLVRVRTVRVHALVLLRLLLLVVVLVLVDSGRAAAVRAGGPGGGGVVRGHGGVVVVILDGEVRVERDGPRRGIFGGDEHVLAILELLEQPGEAAELMRVRWELDGDIAYHGRCSTKKKKKKAKKMKGELESLG
jgi:hypothetical protein